MSAPSNRDRLTFFLGGYDLEMETIADVLRDQVLPDQICDHHLAWGAKASAYEHEIEAAMQAGRLPVLIELQPDVALPETAILIDHHNERAGSDCPTSLEQIWNLLAIPASQRTRWQQLVCANDRGYVSAMQALGASLAEMLAIRQDDRRAQGVTQDEERTAEAAVASAQLLCAGRLTVVNIPHDRASPVTDRLEPALGGPGYENLLVRGQAEVMFFGSGTLVEKLQAGFPGGWWGGALPQRGYWGNEIASEQVLSFLADLLIDSDGARYSQTAD